MSLWWGFCFAPLSEAPRRRDLHVSNLRNFKVVERLVEFLGTTEHSFHIDRVARVPFVKRLIKCGSTIKEVAKVGYRRDTPLSNRRSAGVRAVLEIRIDSLLEFRAVLEA